MNKPFVFKLPICKNNDFIDKEDKLVRLSNYIQKPSFELGFQYFLHRTKNGMGIVNNLKTKSKFYYVVNPFEHFISDYENDVSNYSKKYFNIKKNDPKVLSRAFYKMWEIIMSFDLIPDSKITYAALAEGPGSFIQAVIHFKEKFLSGIKNDKIFGVTIHEEDGSNLEMGKQFISYYNKNFPEVLNIHKTYNESDALKYKSRDNGDITKVKTISNFKKDILKSKKYADLVTADGGFIWDDELNQEQESYLLIFGSIVAALRVQNKNGSFVLKIFESFTMVTLKMLYILSSFYSEIYIHKPYFSRSSNSEKYVVCKGFKYDQKKDSKILDKKIKKLEELLEKINVDLYVNDIFENLELPKDFINTFKFLNIEIANVQQIMINKIITFIKEDNYYGEKFHNYRAKQIEATKFWIEKFYPENKSNFKKVRDSIIKEVKERYEYNNSEINTFVKVLI